MVVIAGLAEVVADEEEEEAQEDNENHSVAQLSDFCQERVSIQVWSAKNFNRASGWNFDWPAIDPQGRVKSSAYTKAVISLRSSRWYSKRVLGLEYRLWAQFWIANAPTNLDLFAPKGSRRDEILVLSNRHFV